MSHAITGTCGRHKMFALSLIYLTVSLDVRRFGPTLNGHLEKFSVLEQAKTLKGCTERVSETLSS